jgi:hypothetical protein
VFFVFWTGLASLTNSTRRRFSKIAERGSHQTQAAGCEMGARELLDRRCGLTRFAQEISRVTHAAESFVPEQHRSTILA